eukprot:gene4027-8428_t
MTNSSGRCCGLHVCLQLQVGCKLAKLFILTTADCSAALVLSKEDLT